jgi:hypothetical protein
MGWCSAALAAPAIAWVIFGQRLQSAIRDDVCPGRFCTGGREYVAVALLLGAPACATGLVALTRRRERSFLIVLTVAPAVLFTAFWLFFAIGELLAG